MIALLALLFLLAGCTSDFGKRYPDDCVLAKPASKEESYTTATFPCRLHALVVPAEPKAP